MCKKHTIIEVAKRVAKSCTGEAPEALENPLKLSKSCSRLHGSSLFTFPVFLLNAAKKAPRCSTLGAPGGCQGTVPEPPNPYKILFWGGTPSLGCPLGAKVDKSIQYPKLTQHPLHSPSRNAKRDQKGTKRCQWFSAFPLPCVRLNGFPLFSFCVVFRFSTPVWFSLSF